MYDLFDTRKMLAVLEQMYPTRTFLREVRSSRLDLLAGGLLLWAVVGLLLGVLV